MPAPVTDQQAHARQGILRKVEEKVTRIFLLLMFLLTHSWWVSCSTRESPDVTISWALS